MFHGLAAFVSLLYIISIGITTRRINLVRQFDLLSQQGRLLQKTPSISQIPVGTELAPLGSHGTTTFHIEGIGGNGPTG